MENFKKKPVSISTISEGLNHPLGVISNYIYGCIRRIESGNFNIEEILLALKSATLQSHRAAEIILRMNDLNYKGTINAEIVCMNSLVKETIKLIKYEIVGYPVTINYKPLHQPIMIRMDKAKIQQVILNLARNSLEAMRDAHTTNPQLFIEMNKFSPESIEVNIVDNGPGFIEEIAYKLFETHFTTKPYGIGLGLATSKSIIEAHGGILTMNLNSLRGACAKFTLSNLA